MSKEVLRAMSGIEIFPVISLVLFVVVFTAVVVWALRLDGRQLERHALLPLEPGESAAPRSGKESPRDTEAR